MTAWLEYEIARHPGRPSPRYYAHRICTDLFELRGDRNGGDDPATFAALGRFDSFSIAIAAFDRKSPNASGFRKATRLIELAGRLALPIVTLVDTPGADPSFESEYGGLAAAIAGTFEAILTVKTPVISIVSGEGGSGGALALVCGDTIAVQEHAVFSVIAPEGAAEILHRDPSRAAEVAEQLRPASMHLVALGLADSMIVEPRGGAHSDPEAAAATLGNWLGSALGATRADPAARARRFAQIKPLN